MTLVPSQRPITRGRKTSLNLHQRRMPKHAAQISRFESRAEYYFGGLLEGDGDVLNFIPQPFDLPLKEPVAGKWTYRPDFYVRHQDGREVVIEVTTEEQAPSRPVDQVKPLLEKHGMAYELVKTDAVFERELEAENWLIICQYVVLFDDGSIDHFVDDLRHHLRRSQLTSMQEIGVLYPHIPQACRVGAVCLLAHAHEIAFVDLTTQPLTARTRFHWL